MSEQTADRLRRIESDLNLGLSPLSEDAYWLLKLVKDYDSIICWETTCAESARLLDKSYEDYQKIQDLNLDRNQLKFVIEGIKKYLQHKITCPDWGHHNKDHKTLPCNCGLNDFLIKTEQKTK